MSPVLSFFIVAFKSVKFMVKFDSAAFASVSRRQLVGLSTMYIIASSHRRSAHISSRLLR